MIGDLSISALGLCPPAMTNQLRSGETLATGGTLQAPTRPVTLVMQADGDLVLLKSGSERLWASETAGRGGTHVQMKPGGNLVLIGHRATIWETKTSGHRGARLVVQDDGNLVVYGKDKKFMWAGRK